MSSPQPQRPDLSALRIDRSYEQDGGSAGFLRWIIVALVVAGAGAALYLLVIAPRTVPAVELLRVQPVVNVQRDQLLTATGYLVADRQSNVTSKVAGRVTRVAFDVGAVVEKGAVLVLLESEDLAAQLREAEAMLSEAQREHDRQQALWRDGVVSRALYESAASQLAVTRARLDRLRVVMRDMVVRAPFTGTVTNKSVEIGEVVSPTYMGSQPGNPNGSGAIARLADLSTLEVEADVNEGNVGKLRVGQPAEVTVDAFPGRKFRARLRKIIPTANRAKGVVQVRVEITDDKAGLLPEMSSSVAFLEREKTAAEAAEQPKIWVNAGAIRREGGQAFVLTVGSDSTIEYKPVTIGETRDGRNEIVRGLAAGEQIVAKGVNELKRGTRVRLAEAGA